MDSLLTNDEIREFLGLDHKLEVCSDAQRFRYEHKEFKDCFGSSFYNQLKTSLAVYNDYSTYLDATSYAQDDVVEYSGKLYVALKATTGVPPSNITNWKPAPKFDSGAEYDYEKFYCTYLGPYLAHVVVRARLPYLRSKLTGDGLIQVNKDGYENASQNSYKALSDRLSTDIDLLYDMVVDYMKDNNSDGKFTISEIITDTDCEDACEDKGSASSIWDVA